MGFCFFYTATKQFVLCVCGSFFLGWFCFDLFGGKQRMFILSATGTKKVFFLAVGLVTPLKAIYQKQYQSLGLF